MCLKCATKTIPRGKIPEYKAYWSENLSKLTKDRDEIVKEIEHCWSQEKQEKLQSCQTKLEEELNKTKNSNFLEKLKNLDFRGNGPNTHKEIR